MGLSSNTKFFCRVLRKRTQIAWQRASLLICFDAVVHLTAQAGVRYSIDNPRAYTEANLLGTFELLEAARAFPPKHLLLASTSSVYGANSKMPYRETDQVDHQMSYYGV